MKSIKLRTYLLPAALLLALPLLSPAAARAATKPDLGTAGTFAVLAGSTVTNTGLTTLIGDLGVSPGSAATGFPPGVVVGATHANATGNDAAAMQAQTDATNAYLNLKGQPCDHNLTGQDLGAKTLTPGVYCFSSSAQLTGQLILDGQGNPSSVFIFQIGSTLTTASNASVVFINGAQPCSSNIFWQVGSSATLGTNTSFTGNILALTSITLNTRTATNGGLYAQTGAVTLDTNNVVRNNQACGTAPTVTATSIAPTATVAPATATGTAPSTSTSTSTPTATATGAAPSTNTSTSTSTPRATMAPPTATVTGTTPRATRTNVAITTYRTVTRYKTVMVRKTTMVMRYKTVLRPKTTMVTRYKTVLRPKTVYHTIVLYKTQIRTVVTYTTHVRQHVKQVVHTTTVVHNVKHVTYTTIVRHKTITTVITTVQVQKHPKTGRFAGPVARHSLYAMPRPDASISVARLGILSAPVWSRGYTDDGYGGFTYDIVPYYGATSFSYSAPFGQPGLSMAYGHDDEYGSIFHYLGQMKRGDAIQVARGSHRYTYIVRSVSIVSPDDVSLLTAPRSRPTLALITCTPYNVDTHRVVVLADMQ